MFITTVGNVICYLRYADFAMLSNRYNDEIELEDAVHTAILTVSNVCR